MKENKEAGRATKVALSLAQPECFKLPCTAIYPIFVAGKLVKVKEVGNKLPAIMPQIDEKCYARVHKQQR